MTGMALDFRFAVRTLRKAPVFAGVAILSLALGIGANSAIFTLTDQLILRLLPVRGPGAIVLLEAPPWKGKYSRWTAMWSRNAPVRWRIRSISSNSPSPASV
jgi:hypothetical protein